MKEEIKKLRIKIDGLAQLTKELKPIEYTLNEVELKYYKEFNSTEGKIVNVTQTYSSREIEKAVDSLYLAKAWLGKVLGELGTENPYGSGYKTKEDIVPTQDVAYKPAIEHDLNPFENKTWEEKSHIEKVDYLRTEISKLDAQVHNLAYSKNNPVGVFDKGDNYFRALNLMESLVRQYLCEARFWLGFEMERIKNN